MIVKTSTPALDAYYLSQEQPMSERSLPPAVVKSEIERLSKLVDDLKGKKSSEPDAKPKAERAPRGRSRHPRTGRFT